MYGNHYKLIRISQSFMLEKTSEKTPPEPIGAGRAPPAPNTPPLSASVFCKKKNRGFMQEKSVDVSSGYLTVKIWLGTCRKIMNNHDRS